MVVQPLSYLGHPPEELDSVQVFFEPKHYVCLISTPVMAFIVCMCSGSRGIFYRLPKRRNPGSAQWPPRRREINCGDGSLRGFLALCQLCSSVCTTKNIL